MGSRGDDPTQHDVPVPSELEPGATVRTTGPAYWYQSVPVGTVGTVVRVDPVVVGGSRAQVVVDAEIRGVPVRLTLPDDVLTVVASRPGLTT